MVHIVHLTSVHPRYDTRILIKECCSLAKHFSGDNHVTLVVADGLPGEHYLGVDIISVAREKNRFRRACLTTRLIQKKAIALNADIYHLHDPELLPVAIKLKRLGKIVIFDAHENFPQQLLSKDYLYRWQKKLLSYLAARYERFVGHKIDGIITATQPIADKFKSVNENTLAIHNYPLRNELHVDNVEWDSKTKSVCYIGAITRHRGITQLLEAISLLPGDDILLNLAGQFQEKNLEEACRQLIGYSRTWYHGQVSREGVKAILQDSMVGLVTLLPIVNYIDSLPVKMFEYMAAGIPVIASDFPLWKSIIERYECGICLDPTDTYAISQAIQSLLSDPLRAQKMGNNGRLAVIEHYNWEAEALRLIQYYEALILSSRTCASLSKS